MVRSSHRLLIFAVAVFGGLGLLVVLLWLSAQSPRSIRPSPVPPTPTARTVARIDDEPIRIDEWQQAVALDQVMSGLVGQAAPSPEETLDQMINRRLVLREAVAAGIPEAQPAQADAWLANFLTGWDLDEVAFDQALTRAGLSRAELLEEIVPHLLRVQQALQELPPGDDADAWVAELRDRAKVQVFEKLSVSLPPGHAAPPVGPTPEPALPALTLSAGPRVGDLAPDFSLPATDGTTMALADLRGHPLLLNFWAAWCTACRDDLPMLQAAHQASSEDQDELIVLAINVREPPDQVTAVATELGLALPVLLDRDGQVSDAYQVRGLPTSLVVGRDGAIVARHVGPLDQATLDSYLLLLLAMSPSTP